LERALGDSEEYVRGAALDAAGQIGEPALHLIERGLEDDSVYVRLSSVYAAMETRALRILKRAMNDESASVRSAAVLAAGYIGRRARAIVERALKDSDPDVRKNALYVASRFAQRAAR
jgi:HEAT repeat protein